MAGSNFNLGPKAIQAIQGFTRVLNRFPRAERLSMIRYLQNVVGGRSVTLVAGGVGAGSTAGRTVRSKAWKSGAKARAGALTTRRSTARAVSRRAA